MTLISFELDHFEDSITTFRPYYQVMYEKVWHRCRHGKSIISKWLEIWEKISIKFAKKRHFSFTFLSGLTHVAMNNVQLYDIPLIDSLVYTSKDSHCLSDSWKVQKKTWWIIKTRKVIVFSNPNLSPKKVDYATQKKRKQRENFHRISVLKTELRFPVFKNSVVQKL